MVPRSVDLVTALLAVPSPAAAYSARPRPAGRTRRYMVADAAPAAPSPRQDARRCRASSRVWRIDEPRSWRPDVRGRPAPCSDKPRTSSTRPARPGSPRASPSPTGASAGCRRPCATAGGVRPATGCCTGHRRLRRRPLGAVPGAVVRRPARGPPRRDGPGPLRRADRHDHQHGHPRSCRQLGARRRLPRRLPMPARGRAAAARRCCPRPADRYWRRAGAMNNSTAPPRRGRA